MSHSRVRCRFLGTLECTASADLGPFPSPPLIQALPRPRLGSGGRLEAGKRLYALPDILAEPSPTGKQFNFTRPSANLPIGNPVPSRGFCQRRVLWALCPTHLTGSGRMRGSPVPPNTLLMSRYKCACQWCVCCPYRTQAFPCPGICALLLRMREGCALSIACIVWGDPV